MSKSKNFRSIRRKRQEIVENEAFGDCVNRIAREIRQTPSGQQISNMEIIARQIVSGSIKGNHKMLSLFVDIMNAEQMKIEQYNFELPQFVYNINIEKND